MAALSLSGLWLLHSARRERTLKKATQRTGLSLQKEAITSWKGILTGALCGWAELGKTCEMR